MNRYPVTIILSIAALCYAINTQAHHSMAAEFDPDLTGELTGEISEVWFRNPHVRYAIEVTNEDGQQETWQLLSNSIISLRNVGWDRDTLKQGDVITVSGALGRDGRKILHLENVIREDGTVLMGHQLETPAATDRNSLYASADKDYGYANISNDYPHDITGPWRNRYKWVVTVNDLEPKPTPFTSEGRRIFEATGRWDDASFRCIAPGLPRIFGAPYAMEVLDAGNHYVVVHVEFNMPRRIWMDGRTPPADTPDSTMGYSVGHWEGDTLVIETTHLLPGRLDGSGLPMSGEGTRLVEHWKQNEDGLTMDRTMWIHDPYYTAPLVRHRWSSRHDEPLLVEQDACDPDGFYRDMYNENRLGEHFSNN